MFKNILQFELRYQAKQLAFLLMSLLFLGMGIQVGKLGYGRGTVIYNAPQSISEITGIMSLGSVFIIMFFTIHGVLRDSRYHFQPLVFSTPVKKRSYFWSQFFGVFLMSTLAFSMFLLGFALTTLWPGLDPELVHPFSISSYLWTLLIIVIPNIFICSAIVFSVSLLSKSNVATYASAILIYAFYFICSLFLNSPVMANAEPLAADSYVMAALLDPFGLSALFEQTQFWTPFEKNMRFIAFEDYFMWNRVIWIAVGLGVLMASYGLFSFRKSGVKERRKKENVLEVPAVASAGYRPVTTYVANQWRSFIALFTLELKNTFKSLPFIAIALMWVVIILIEIFSRIVEGGAYNDSLYPATYKMIEMFIDPLLFLGYVLIVFYSGESVWRERTINIISIVDSTPVKNVSLFAAKTLALICLPFVLIAMGIVMSLGVQVLFDFHQYDMAMYLSLFYYPGLTFVIYALCAVCIQSMIPNKYLGMGVTGLMIIFLGTSLSSYTGIEHPMLLLGNLPGINFTGMNGFSGIVKGYNYLALYWMLFAGILTFFSFRLWRRGVLPDLAPRIRFMRDNFSKKAAGILGGMVILFCCTGATVYYNLHVATPYISSVKNLDLREAYEREYKRYEDIDGLFPVKMETRVDLFPTDRRYVVNATYVLRNKSNNLLTTYMVTERGPLQAIEIEGGNLIRKDEALGAYIFEFQEGIAPGQEVVFTYTLNKKVSGFETSKHIVDNGTYIQQRDFEPSLGYRESMEIRSSLERKQRGLPEKEEKEITEDHITNTESSVGRVHFTTTVSTDLDQVALSSGALVRQWEEGGRNYFQYHHDGLLMPAVGYFSANYSTRKDDHHGIAIEQYFLPENDFNIDRIAEAAKMSLDYCIENFGAYPFEHLRIAQVPSHWPFGGFAHPGTISMTEDRLYLVDLRDSLSFDLVAKRTIHEVAHQWFGHVLAPKTIEGGSLFVEGLAKYTEAVVMEDMYGKSAIWELSRNANHRYFTYRALTNEPEPPLSQVRGQGYLSYGKSYTVMLALRELIGEETLNGVIRTMVEKHKDQVELELTSVEFLNELYRVTPEVHHKLIDDWFKRVITYDLKIEEVKVSNTTDGKFQIAVAIQTKRFETLNDGSTVPEGIDEPISIGVFEKHPKDHRLRDIPVHMEQYDIKGESSTITITVDKMPAYISIDPYGTRNDEDLSNNTYQIQ